MLTLPGIIQSLSTLADGATRIKVDFNEMSSDKFAELHKSLRTPIFITLSEGSSFSKEEFDFLDSISDELSGEKSQSKRLRNVLYLNHKELNKGTEDDFEEFYKEETEKIINHYKKKLPKD